MTRRPLTFLLLLSPRRRERRTRVSCTHCTPPSAAPSPSACLYGRPIPNRPIFGSAFWSGFLFTQCYPFHDRVFFWWSPSLLTRRRSRFWLHAVLRHLLINEIAFHAIGRNWASELHELSKFMHLPWFEYGHTMYLRMNIKELTDRQCRNSELLNFVIDNSMTIPGYDIASFALAFYSRSSSFVSLRFS